MTKALSKPIFYLDVDGVLYWQTDITIKIRDGIFDLFLGIRDLGFELQLLSYNPEGGRAFLDVMKHSGYGLDFDHVISAIPIRYNGRGALDKMSYVDTSRPFLWVDDSPLQSELEFLEEKGWANRLYWIKDEESDFSEVVNWMTKFIEGLDG